MMKPKQEAEPMAAEQAAELAALEQVAGGEVAADKPGKTADTQAPAVDLATELRALVQMFVGMVGPVFPSLPKIYTPEATEAASIAVAAVCNKHGWMQGGIMGEYAEEIAAAAVLAPLALATYQGVRADIAAIKKPKATQAGALPDNAATVADDGAINQKTVVFGAPIPSPEATDSTLQAAA